jgi:hypothetical protein
MSLSELLAIPESERNQSWENQFFQSLCSDHVHLLFEQPQQGPDGWPYLLVESEDVYQKSLNSHAVATEVQANKDPESVQKILSWIATRGVGLALNPRKEYPDYVFSFGMIWSFRETGFFYKPIDPSRKSGAVELSNEKGLSYAEPSEAFLPKYVRQILKEFFRDQGLHAVKLSMISEDQAHFDLAFSLESLGNPPQPEHQQIAEAIGWFLPPHYSVLLVSEKDLPIFSAL